MDWLTAYKIPLGSWIKIAGRPAQRACRGLLRLHLLGAGRPDRRHDRGADRRSRRSLLIVLVALLAWFLHRSWQLVALVVISLLLIINLGYWRETLETLALVVSATAICMLIGMPLGHPGGAPAALLHGAAPDPRPDADHPDLRLPDPDPDPVRPGRGAGPDLDRDLRAAGADPAHLSGRQPRAAAADRGRPELRRQPARSSCGRSSCPTPCRPSWPASPNASCCPCRWS